MNKVISFSLFGNNPKYIVGAKCNVEIAKIIYPDWTCRFYCGESVDENYVQELKNHDNTEVILMKENDEVPYMSWRFFAADDSDITIFRDADSRLSYREKKLVDEFIESDFMIHDIRDHYLHDNIMGGMWGIKKGLISNFKEIIVERFIDEKNSNEYGKDQFFLRDYIVKNYKKHILVHDSKHDRNTDKDDGKFKVENIKINPVNNNHRHFIGEVIHESNFNKSMDNIFC